MVVDEGMRVEQWCNESNKNTTRSNVGRDSSVGMAIRYGLYGPGIEAWWGRDFTNPSRPTLGPTQPPVQWVPGLSREKKAGVWR